MKTSECGLQLIKDAEGLRLTAYQCSAGVWTIGYGHTGASGIPYVTKGMTISKAEADRVLKSDMRKFEDAINKLVKVPLKQSQFDALVSFVFNVGESKFAGSTLLRELNKENYQRVPSELAKWNKAGGKVSKGLAARRAKEAALWVEDEWEADEEPNLDQTNIGRETPTVINKENASFAAGIVGTAAAPLASGAPPIQWALAAIMVIGFAVGLYLFFKRRGL